MTVAQFESFEGHLLSDVGWPIVELVSTLRETKTSCYCARLVNLCNSRWSALRDNQGQSMSTLLTLTPNPTTGIS